MLHMKQENMLLHLYTIVEVEVKGSHPNNGRNRMRPSLLAGFYENRLKNLLQPLFRSQEAQKQLEQPKSSSIARNISKLPNSEFCKEVRKVLIQTTLNSLPLSIVPELLPAFYQSPESRLPHHPAHPRLTTRLIPTNLANLATASLQLSRKTPTTWISLLPKSPKQDLPY